jgi:hypothetical protein
MKMILTLVLFTLVGLVHAQSDFRMGGGPMKRNLGILLLVATVLTGSACNAAQVRGTYVAHASTFAEMLQLTQASDSQISGVLSHVELKQNGRVSSEQTPLKPGRVGFVDDDTPVANQAKFDGQ